MSPVACLVALFALCLPALASAASAQPGRASATSASATASGRGPDFGRVSGAGFDMPALVGLVDGAAAFPLDLGKTRRDGMPNDRFSRLLSISLVGQVPSLAERVDGGPTSGRSAPSSGTLPSSASLGPGRLVAGAAVLLLLGWRRRYGRRG